MVHCVFIPLARNLPLPVSYCFWEICSKNTGLQGSTLSGHRMTTGFGPFELPNPESYLTAFCARDSSPHLLVTPGLVLAETRPVQWVTFELPNPESYSPLVVSGDVRRPLVLGVVW